MLSKERKAKLVESLREDYVVLTDVIVEVVADTEADMLILKMAGRNTPEQEKDKEKLCYLDEQYSKYFETDPVKAVDIAEQIFDLSEKYDRLRMQM